MAVGTNTTVNVLLTAGAWVEVLDGTLFSGGTIFLDSGLPLKIAIAAAPPSAATVDWIPLNARVTQQQQLVLEAGDNVYAMPVTGDAALQCRVLRVTR